MLKLQNHRYNLPEMSETCSFALVPFWIAIFLLSDFFGHDEKVIYLTVVKSPTAKNRGREETMWQC